VTDCPSLHAPQTRGSLLTGSRAEAHYLLSGEVAAFFQILGVTMKSIKFWAYAVTAGALVAAGGTSHAMDLVTNGSFESGTFDDIDIAFVPNITQVGGSQSNTKISGWTVSQTRPLIWIDNAYALPLKTPYGDRFLDLTFYTNAVSQYSSISQTLTTTANTNYTLSFSLGASNFFGLLPVIALSTAGLTVNFAVTAAPSASSNWTTFSYTFTALSTATPITFTGIQGSDYIGLDNVSVTAVPEPGSIALMLAGLAIIGSVANRRRPSR
jgi:Protein of unknown function (DUF642)/PEP-CTERM motif